MFGSASDDYFRSIQLKKNLTCNEFMNSSLFFFTNASTKQFDDNLSKKNIDQFQIIGKFDRQNAWNFVFPQVFNAIISDRVLIILTTGYSNESCLMATGSVPFRTTSSSFCRFHKFQQLRTLRAGKCCTFAFILIEESSNEYSAWLIVRPFMQTIIPKPKSF